jgi:hypothetical protein
MALKSPNTSTGGVYRTAGPTFNQPWTQMARMRPDALVTFGSFLCFGNATAAALLQFNSNTANVMCIGVGSQSSNILAVTTGRWYDCFLSGDGTQTGTTLTGSMQATGSPSALASQSAQSAGNGLAASIGAGVGVLSGGGGGETFNGAIRDVMIWTVQLTADEKEQQRLFSYPVVRLDKLWAWIPSPDHGDVFDYSGNARHFTSSSTITSPDDPWVPQPSPAVRTRMVIYSPSAPPASGAVQRRTLGHVGTRIGSRKAA